MNVRVLCTGSYAIFFYLTWRGNGLADFDKIWHAERAIIGFSSVREKIGPKPLRNVYYENALSYYTVFQKNPLILLAIT